MLIISRVEVQVSLYLSDVLQPWAELLYQRRDHSKRRAGEPTTCKPTCTQAALCAEPIVAVSTQAVSLNV